VRLWFTDVAGTLKSVAIAPAEVEGAFAEGLGFDGSAIEGLSRSYEADMLAQPDPSTFQILPWRGEIDPTARMFCDIMTPDGQPAAADPRNVLRRALAKARLAQKVQFRSTKQVISTMFLVEQLMILDAAPYRCLSSWVSQLSSVTTKAVQVKTRLTYVTLTH
jgi:glutamine synthetase